MTTDKKWNAFYRGVLDKIDKHGFMVQGVFPRVDDPDDLSFAYSVGLTTYDHPEFLIYGLPARTAQIIINDLGDRVMSGTKFHGGERLDDVLRDYDVYLVKVTEEHECNIARYLYHEIEVLQIVWPDEDGHFPWDDMFSLRGVPVLGSQP